MEVFRAVRAELLKLKRTKALWLTITAPLFVVFLNFVMLFNNRHAAESAKQLWDTHIVDANMGMWFIIMNTLYVTLMIALVAGVEHSSNTWKYLFSLPISRSSILVAKIIIAIGLSVTANILLLVFAVGSGFVAEAIQPHLGFNNSKLHLGQYGELTMLASSLSLLMIVLQTWLSVRLKSFIIPLGVGFMGAIATLIASSSGIFQRFWPWTYPLDGLIVGRSSSSFDYHGWPLSLLLIINCTGFLMVAIFAMVDMRKRDIF